MPTTTECCINALKWVCQTYQLDFNDVLSAYKAHSAAALNNNAAKSYKHMDIDHDKCIARLKRDDQWEQCSRTRKKEHFCLTHYKQFTEGALKYGYFEEDDCHLSALSKASNKPLSTSSSRTVSLELVTVKHVDYLYDAATCYVYNFHTKKKIGRLDQTGAIIPFAGRA